MEMRGGPSAVSNRADSIQVMRVGRENSDLRTVLAAVEQSSPIDAVDVLGAELARSVDAARQVVQELAYNLLDVTGGHLQDDATALCLDRYGTSGIRSATGGASRSRATA